MITSIYNSRKGFAEKAVTVACLSAVFAGLLFCFVYFFGFPLCNVDFAAFIPVVRKNELKFPGPAARAESPAIDITPRLVQNAAGNNDTILSVRVDSLHRADTQQQALQPPRTPPHRRNSPPAKPADAILPLLAAARKAIFASQYQEAYDLITRCGTGPSSSMYSADIAYLCAKAITGLYLSGGANGPRVIASWRNVIPFYSKGSDRFHEADSMLSLFGVLQ
jgi:hypothetical protein